VDTTSPADADGVSSIDQLTNSVRTVLAHHVLEVGEDPVFVLNSDDRIILASRASATFGWPLPALIGREWRELVHPADDAATGALRESPSIDGRFSGLSRVVRVESADGTWTRMRMTVYSAWAEGAGAVTVLVLRDQT
jgi:PAS domain S-box-containing protein